MKCNHVFITGGSRGLGRALARKFHKEGSHVTFIGRTESDLHNLKQELGDRADYWICDLAGDTSHIRETVEKAIAGFGPIDLLINNAGTGRYQSFLEQDYGEIEQIIKVNVTSLICLTRIIADHMKDLGHGEIINIASDLGRRPMANMAVYASTKHAVVGFSQSLARELKEHGLKCMVLAPGIIDTYFGGSEEGDMEEADALQPDQLANVVYYLAHQPEHVLIDELSIHPLNQDF